MKRRIWRQREVANEYVELRGSETETQSEIREIISADKYSLPVNYINIIIHHRNVKLLL